MSEIEARGPLSKRKKHAQQILQRLKRHYELTGPFIDFHNPLELVIGTVLSAQCTDVRVNIVTKKLFRKYKKPSDYAKAQLSTLEKEIYSTGFYKSKAKYLKGIGDLLEKKFGGKVPQTYNELVELPGVSHKTAFLILAKAFHVFEGIAVDTHVFRLSPRMGLSSSKTPEKMAKDLAELFPPQEYLNVNEYFITHGRAVCSPGIPKCGECILRILCPASKKFLALQEQKEKKKK